MLENEMGRGTEIIVRTAASRSRRKFEAHGTNDKVRTIRNSEAPKFSGAHTYYPFLD